MMGSLIQMWHMPNKSTTIASAKEVEANSGEYEMGNTALLQAPAPNRPHAALARWRQHVSRRKVYFAAGGLLGVLFIIFFLAAFVRTGAHFQRFLDHVHLTRGHVRHLAKLPAQVHDVHDGGFTLTSAPFMQIPSSMRIDDFVLSVMDTQDRTVARVHVPGYGSRTTNVTVRVVFDPIHYDALHHIVRGLSLTGMLHVKLDANMTARTLGITSRGRLQRDLSVPSRRWSTVRHTKLDPATPTPREREEILEFAELFAAQVMQPGGMTAAMRRKTPNLRAEFGRVRFGMYMTNRRLMSLSTDVAIQPHSTIFALHQGAYLPDAIQHVNTTVQGMLQLAHHLHPTGAVPPAVSHLVKIPVHLIGEHAQAAEWLNVVVRSLRHTMFVPLEVLESWLVRNGVPRQAFEQYETSKPVAGSSALPAVSASPGPSNPIPISTIV